MAEPLEKDVRDAGWERPPGSGAPAAEPGRVQLVFTSTRRLFHCLRVLLRHALAYFVAPKLASWPLLGRVFTAAEMRGPERLRVFFEDLGGTFVKFGQMLALQPDILPLEYCNALFKLLDQVEPFEYTEVVRTFAEELGRRPEEIFDFIDSEPLATASVGQVHVAYLAGQKVAVKVQRPNVRMEFRSDVMLMVVTIRVIRWFHLRPLYWMLEPMGEFVSWTEEELDYRHEARYSEELRKCAAESAIQYVPAVYTRYTTRRTLVVEFLEGISLLDYLRARGRGDQVLLRRLQKLGFDHKRFAANIIDNFLGDAFRHGIYHADLHPANLMILKDNVVGYIDFGITGVMSQYSRRHLMAMTLALAQGDLQGLYEQFLKLSAVGPRSDPQGFRAGLERLTIDWYEGDGPSRRLQVNFTRVMTDMLQLSRQMGVMPERDIIKYIRSALAIDGLIIRFESDFHVGKHLERSCRRYVGWQALRSSLSYENMFSWSSSGTRLLTEGVSRSADFLDHLVRGDLTVRTQIAGNRAPNALDRSRALQLAGMIFTLALLMSLTGQPVELGFNLFTAELALIVGGLALLFPTLGRLA